MSTATARPEDVAIVAGNRPMVVAASSSWAWVIDATTLCDEPPAG